MESPTSEKKKKERQDFFAYIKESNLEKWPEGNEIFFTPSIRAPLIKYESSRLSLDGKITKLDGPLFKGKMISRLKHHGQSTSNERYFSKKSRKFAWVVQGRFKKRIGFDNVVTGQEFERPFRNRPNAQIIKRGIEMLRNRLPESFECDLFSSKPMFEHPLICGCNSFRIDPYDPKVEALDKIIGTDGSGQVIEDISLLNDADIPKNGEKRKKYFSKNKTLKKYFYEPDKLYTFEFYSNWFNPLDFRLDLAPPILSFDLTPYFNGYPLLFAMAKEKSSNEYLFATEIWHRKLLQFEVAKTEPKRLTFRRKNCEKWMRND